MQTDLIIPLEIICQTEYISPLDFKLLKTWQCLYWQINTLLFSFSIDLVTHVLNLSLMN